MKTNTRFIKNAVNAAVQEVIVLPWTRGARRAAFIAKRQEPVLERKSA